MTHDYKRALLNWMQRSLLSSREADKGMRLVHVTPPIKTRWLGSVCEASWSPAEMPLTYATAPTVIDNTDRSDVPLLANSVANVTRFTPVARFSSAFRSCRVPLAGEIGAQIVSVYKRFAEGRGCQQLRESNALSAASHRARSSFAILRFKSSMGPQEPTSEGWWAEVLAGIRTRANPTDVTKAPLGAPIFLRPPIPPEQRLATHLQPPTL